jgi:hypothetical protein
MNQRVVTVSASYGEHTYKQFLLRFPRFSFYNYTVGRSAYVRMRVSFMRALRETSTNNYEDTNPANLCIHETIERVHGYGSSLSLSRARLAHRRVFPTWPLEHIHPPLRRTLPLARFRVAGVLFYVTNCK